MNHTFKRSRSLESEVEISDQSVSRVEFLKGTAVCPAIAPFTDDRMVIIIIIKSIMEI
jgi:hypothetical protein